MAGLNITADELVAKLLRISESETVCILDSCGVAHLGSHLLIAGLGPVEVVEIRDTEVAETLSLLDKHLTGDRAVIFTLSYDLGTRILNIPTRDRASFAEPEVFLASFDALIIHDYSSGETTVAGNEETASTVRKQLRAAEPFRHDAVSSPASVRSNFSKTDYLAAVERVRERIRCGDTYQTNLTHQVTAELTDAFTPQEIFLKLRLDHPAPFAAFLKRGDSTVISASPERFFKIEPDRTISTSPIKGTRPRGSTPQEDERLRSELLASEKDLAENTMIVDLLRNDLGRICEFGSVEVEKLCEIEEHPTFFNLVSTINGKLRADARVSDIIRAMFPCGSITGAPKISTMKIIDEIETAPRGLSMGAIGYYAPAAFGLPSVMDLSVAIRTMVIREPVATFNVGGGITIDSSPADEWDETLTKATALLNAIGGNRSLSDGV